MIHANNMVAMTITNTRHIHFNSIHLIEVLFCQAHFLDHKSHIIHHLIHILCHLNPFSNPNI